MTRARGAALPPVAAVFALAAAAPLLFDASVDVLHDMVLAAAYVVMALGLNVIVGFAGLLDLGYVAFFAIGAYTAAYFGSGFWANAGSDGRGIAILVGDSAAGMPGIHLNFLLILVLAVAATAVAGALIGVPTLRLRGDYIAIVTLAFGEIIGQIASNGRKIELFGGTLTSGPIGIGPIDRIELPLIGRFGALDLRPWYWFALALVALALVVSVNLRDSRFGRAWIAMRDDERAAAGAGIPVVRTKLLAYGTGAALGGISGAFFASYLGVVNAAQFEFSFSIFIFAMVVLGGLGSIAGVVVGAIVLSVVNNYLLPDVLFDLPGKVGLAFDLSAISSGIYGAILVVMMLLRPHGLVPPTAGAVPPLFRVDFGGTRPPCWDVVGTSTRMRDEDAEHAAAPPEPAEPAEPDRRGPLTPPLVLALQQSAGNVAARSLLLRNGDPPGATATPTATPDAESDVPELAPETPKKEPEHPPAPKLGMDLASGEKVLTNAFGTVKKIAPGKVELLAQADFQKAYDKIYGAGQYSWDKYVKPKFGNLEGFADKGVNYINTDLAHLDTVVHEMLHNNVASDWRDVVGHDFDEGATEILTIAACKKIGVPSTVSYPGENPVVQAALDAGLPFDDLVQAYLAGGAQKKIADWVDKTCKESFAKVKEYMAAQNWAAAKAAMAKKT